MLPEKVDLNKTGTMELPRDDYGIQDQSSVAVPAAPLQYGRADAWPRIPAVERSDRSPLAGSRFRFLVGEVTGILFILLSAVYIFLTPVSLGRSMGVRAMIGRAIKRTIDVVGATVGLIVTAPIMLLVAIAVKIDSPGPVFYSQIRVGEDRRRRDRRFSQWSQAEDRRRRDRRRDNSFGRPFRIYKFRTMVNNAEKMTGPVWATQNDKRITRLGRFLRKTRLDEIPQFWSVLKGDMSLVGPRPERPMFVKDLSTKVDNYAQRLQVKPGLTGLAQVEIGYDTSIESVRRKTDFDLKYIKNWSLWQDVKILLKTVVVVVTGRGAN